MATKASISHAKYDAANTTGVYLKLNLKTDSDILEKLSSVPNRQGYIKQLIRQDISTGSVPTPATGSAPVSVPKKRMTPKQILSFLEQYTKYYDGSMYELLNAVTNEYMNND